MKYLLKCIFGVDWTKETCMCQACQAERKLKELLEDNTLA